MKILDYLKDRTLFLIINLIIFLIMISIITAININLEFILIITKNKVYTENKGMTTTVLFVGMYLGIVFLISSMAVLSLQQLSEASDSIERYKSLKRIGANDKQNHIRSNFNILYITLGVSTYTCYNWYRCSELNYKDVW